MKVSKQGDKVVIKGRGGKGKFRISKKLASQFDVTDKDIQEVEYLLAQKVGEKVFTQQELNSVNLDFQVGR